MVESAARESQLLEDAWLHGQPSETPQPQWSLKTETKKVTRRLLDTALRHVGHLSSVDGAVVVDEHLLVVGFGAKLTADHAEFLVAEWDAVSGMAPRSVSPVELGGTRHQSAARYVFHHHQCTCFVASQDGRLSLFAWLEKDQSVVCIRRLEHFIWEHE